MRCPHWVVFKLTVPHRTWPASAELVDGACSMLLVFCFLFSLVAPFFFSFARGRKCQGLLLLFCCCCQQCT